MLNAIPVFGWLLSAFFSISMAIPFWFLWTVAGYGAKYFYWLPATYLNPGFWDCVCVFIVVSILKSVLLPTFASTNTNNSSK